MPESVAGAIDPGAFAVPQCEHAIDTAFAAHGRLLRAPHRRCRQILVQSGLEADIGGLKLAPGARELHVHAAERRAPVAGDVARGTQTGPVIALFLHQAQANQRLRAREIDVLLVEVVLVSKRNIGKSALGRRRAVHFTSPAAAFSGPPLPESRR